MATTIINDHVLKRTTQSKLMPTRTTTTPSGIRPTTFFDDIRRSPYSLLETAPNSNVIVVNDTYRLAHIVSLLPISQQGEIRIDAASTTRGSDNTTDTDTDTETTTTTKTTRVITNPLWLEMSATNYLAMNDFNRRQSLLLDDNLQELVGNCDLYFTMEFRDTQFIPSIAGRELYTAAVTSPSLQDHATRPDGTTSHHHRPPKRLRPTAVVAASRSVVAEVLATLGGVLEPTPIPVISPLATSRSLEDRERYPYFGRTIVTDKGGAQALCAYLYSIGVTHFGVLFANDTFGQEYWVYTLQAAQEFQLKVIGVSYDAADPAGSIDDAINTLEQSQVKYFFGMFAPPSIREIQSLHNRNMIGPKSNGHIWIFGFAPDLVELTLDMNDEKDRNIAQAVNGTGAIDFYTNPQKKDILRSMLRVLPKEDQYWNHFLSSHKDETLVQLLRDQLTYSYNEVPSYFSMLTYDAVMSLGISMCQRLTTDTGTSSSAEHNRNSQEEDRGGDNHVIDDASTEQDQFPTGEQIYNDFKHVEYHGASGYVAYDWETGTRRLDSVSFQITNIVAQDLIRSNSNRNDTNNDQQHMVQLKGRTSIAMDLENNVAQVIQPFLFPDGTTEIPPTLPEIQHDYNLISNWVLLFCYIVGIGTMMLSLIAMVYTTIHRKRTVIRSSQPIFLNVLCLGTFLMSATVIPLTFQENSVFDSSSLWILDVGCMLGPWLFAIGFSLTFAAILAKTIRIQKVVAGARTFRRVQIRPQDVIKPLIGICCVNIMTLILWTVWNPLHWQRITLNYGIFDRPVESYGTCLEYTHLGPETAPIAALTLFNMVVLMYANYQSYLSRHLPTEYNESFFVALTNAIIVESFIIGGPLLFLVESDPTATALVRTLLVVGTCWAVLLPTFVPKLFATEASRRHVLKTTRYVRLSPMGFDYYDSQFDEVDSIEAEIASICSHHSSGSHGKGSKKYRSHPHHHHQLTGGGSSGRSNFSSSGRSNFQPPPTSVRADFP